MAKAAKVVCDRCESRITVGVSFCGRCGGPTPWASHDERVSWELTQWRTADRRHAGDPASHGGTARRWIPRPFGRKSAQPRLTVIRAKTRPNPIAEAPAPAPAPVKAAVAAVAPPEPKPVSVKTRQVPEIAPASPKSKPARASVKSIARPQPVRSAPKIEPGPRDAEPLRDTPATVMAMRLLNARVAELDAKVRRLERALEGEDAISLP